MTLRITPARKELLQAIEDGAVAEEYAIGRGWFTEWDRGPSDGGSTTMRKRFVTVTAAVRRLHEEGWVRLIPTGVRFSTEPRPWALTAAGKAALDGAS